MNVFTKKELVTKALLSGKEQKKDYSRPSADNPSATIHGTVAVIAKDGVFLISIREIAYPSETFFLEREWDTDESHTIPTLHEVEQLMQSRLGVAIEELGPAKGTKRFQA